MDSYSSRRARWCAARVWQPPPRGSRAIGARFTSIAPASAARPHQPFCGYSVSLPSPTGVQWSPQCLRRSIPASGQAPAAVSSSSSVPRDLSAKGGRVRSSWQQQPRAAEIQLQAARAAAGRRVTCSPRATCTGGAEAVAAGSSGGHAASFARALPPGRARACRPCSRLSEAAAWLFASLVRLLVLVQTSHNCMRPCPAAGASGRPSRAPGGANSSLDDHIFD